MPENRTAVKPLLEMNAEELHDAVRAYVGRELHRVADAALDGGHILTIRSMGNLGHSGVAFEIDLAAGGSRISLNLDERGAFSHA